MFSWLEKRPFFFTLGVILVITFAGIVELLPNFLQASRPLVNVKPYSMLQIAGRQIYISESCNACHSQLIRPFKNETDRYGMYSLSGEYVYDRPFLWGSKRTGPDLMRVGKVRTTSWHEYHMLKPQEVVPGSIMPAYKHLYVKNSDLETAYAEAYTVKTVFNVPYDIEGGIVLGDNYDKARAIALSEASDIVKDMQSQEIKQAVANGEIPQIVSLIAYLNSLK